VCVGIGLILGAQWFGFIPDSRVEQERARRQTCQTVAISVLDDIRHERWLKIRSLLTVLVQRDDEMLSAGIRSDFGSLYASTIGHDRSWQPPSDSAKATASNRTNSNNTIGETALLVPEEVPAWALSLDQAGQSSATPSTTSHSSRSGDSSPKQRVDNTAVHFEIPITIDHRPWGNLEFVFAAPDTGLAWGALDAGLTKLLVFFLVIGMGSYTLLMMRVMGVFSRTQVVPDRVRQALDTLAEGLLVLDESGKIVLANEKFIALNGYEMDELVDRLAADLPWMFPTRDPDEMQAEQTFPWTRAILERQSVVGEILRMTGRDGVHRVFSVNAGPIGESEQQKGALVTFQDVTHVEKHRVELENMLSMLRMSKDEIQQKNQELEILATRDALTGCLNRRAFFERMEPRLIEYRQAGRPLACFMVDVDHFKSVNDTYGHHTGDEVLREVSSVLRELHEATQIVCRYGGEEFCVILPGCSLERAVEEAERTRLAIMNIRLDDPESLRLTASIGVSELKFGAEDVQSLINQADECLYVAKRGGRNQSVAFDPDRVNVLGEEEPESAETILDPNLVSLPFHAVTALLSALAYRDPSTAEHSRRVADLCVHAAKGLLCQRDIYVLEIAALLHDIGKIGVPDQVLHKAGPLDEQEWKVMRRHNSVGLDIVAGTFHCEELEAIIRTHHAIAGTDDSRRRLSVQQIPVAARLLSIADSYDAMVSDHAYRKGSSHDQAAAELRRCAGTQFDPELVEHFLATTGPQREDNALGIPTTRGISFAVPKQTALKIGQQIERLAEAMDAQDLNSLKGLASELSQIAEDSFLIPIMESANKIEATVDESSEEEAQWVELLTETQTLMDLCRATQNAHLVGQ